MKAGRNILFDAANVAACAEGLTKNVTILAAPNTFVVFAGRVVFPSLPASSCPVLFVLFDVEVANEGRSEHSLRRCQCGSMRGDNLTACFRRRILG